MSEAKQEESNFDFNFCGEFLDEAEEEEKREREKPSRKGFRVLMKHIGGFEKWHLLNEDCKREIIKLLDYKSRCKLSFCSKSDYEIVNKIPIHVYSISILENEVDFYHYSKEPFDDITVTVYLDSEYYSSNRIQLVFSQVEDDTRIQWRHYTSRKYSTRSVTIKSSSYLEESVKFAETWLKKCNYEVNSFSVKLKEYPFRSSQIKSLPRCKHIYVSADDVDSFRWWLQKVPEKLSSLHMSTTDHDKFVYPPDIISSPQVMNASDFYFYGIVGFTDEQLLSLKAIQMSFHYINVTENGINRFLKNWVNGKGMEGFKSVVLWSEEERNEHEILRGIDARKWDSYFEIEAQGFCGDFERCCGRGTTYQISSRVNPYESVTLLISNDRVSIYATGTKTEWRGKTYTEYSIPR